MSFVEKLEEFDQKLLLFINGANHPVLDEFMFYMSEKWVMIPFYILLAYFFQKQFGWKFTGIIILGAAAMVSACDLTATHLFKNIFMRYRPTHHLELNEKIHLVHNYKGGQFGFFSSHAANMTALAFYCGYFLKSRLKYYSTIAFTLVLLICWSRIYLGVHYPSDVLAGILAGTTYAFIFIAVFKELENRKIILKP